MTDLHKIWQDDAERVYQERRPLKILFLKSKMADDMLERPVLHHQEM